MGVSVLQLVKQNIAGIQHSSLNSLIPFTVQYIVHGETIMLRELKFYPDHDNLCSVYWSIPDELYFWVSSMLPEIEFIEGFCFFRLRADWERRSITRKHGHISYIHFNPIFTSLRSILLSTCYCERTTRYWALKPSWAERDTCH